MAKSLIDVAFLTEHLKTRPIAAILEDCDEKDDIVALQFMCIVDHEAETRQLYTRINGVVGDLGPKLLKQLLEFRNFGKFRYYEYNVNRRLKSYLLQCKHCELTGPYKWMLTHMSINHNTHTGLKVCTFCNKKDFEEHFKDGSMNECYLEYFEKHQFDRNKNRDSIVAHSYEMLKDVAKKLGLYTVRHQTFQGYAKGSVENFEHNHGEDVANELMVFHPKLRNNNKNIESTKFTEEFERVSNIWFGNAKILGAKRKLHAIAEPIVISDSDDDENESSNARNGAIPSTSAQSNGESSSAVHKTSNDGPIVRIIKREPSPNRNSTSTGPSTSMVEIPAPNIPDPASNIAEEKFNNSTANAPTPSADTKSDSSELFGSFVAQRLKKLPDDRKRQKLEIDIQEAILKAEKDALE